MAINEKDFIELEFTGKVKDGEVFDSNIEEDIKKAGLGIEAKPFVFAVGEGMFLKSIEDFLVGKEMGRHRIELPPERAFGKRDARLIMRIPLKVFREQRISPVQGGVFNFDGRLAKILAVSGGRVMADFNNPIAGKDVIYDLNVKRKVEDINEKIKSFVNFLFKRDFSFEISGKKLVLTVDPGFGKFAELFREKFMDLFGLELEAKEKENDGKNSPENNQL